MCKPASMHCNIYECRFIPSGQYYFIDANANNVRMGDRAVIHLLNDQQRFREGHAQLTLFYHMLDGYGPRNQMGTLNVYMDCGGSRNVTWSVDGNQGYKWNEVVIELQCDQQPVQVSCKPLKVQCLIFRPLFRMVSLFMMRKDSISLILAITRSGLLM